MSKSIHYLWRGPFSNDEVNALHAEAFETRIFTTEEWDWRSLLTRHSLGWVTARDEDRLVGFVNVIWDGLVHAWVQDTMVASDTRRLGIGRSLVDVVRKKAQTAGCEFLHVDFEDHLGEFYYQAYGFVPTSAGLIRLEASTSPIDRSHC
jgi:GNAT superfamily N-acetyltransferase